MTVNIQVLLKSRPAGKPSIDNFEIKEIKIPDIKYAIIFKIFD